ncbi:enoyl-CoA hydratase [Nocardioides sp. ChNu-153]|uniref:enoyl-CoA hydratase n=1 Tax=unclassified Nocardioides TaxID=2615069 RepID=UPI00240679B0|nr:MULTISPECIES: enoyl-CoA hydratase [unclassified Nocardioides]MDF9714942.1 enoyl-CoA hydratase [Nocardioides sp. ChNu-99]MDN7122461.1 enoyl-CoA hydratase [Nocardioides sp. ChNu-153]
MLATTRDGSVSLLTLQRPERRNALSLELCRAIAAAAQEEVDAGARVLVLTGEGSSFCSGADLGGVYGDEFLEALYGMLHGLTRLPVPVVAAVNGPAIGAGTQLALAADLRVADAGARFGVPTARNGMAVDAWTMRTLQEVAGGGLARRLMLAAETVDVDEAVRYGLVDRTGTLDDALAWAAEIATLAPLTLAHNKLVLNGGSDEDVARTFAACWASEDVREAAAARSEKRTPVFRGV